MTVIKRRVALALLALVLVLAATVYLPGTSGPYVFDDRTNIVRNSYLRIDSLSYQDLSHASFAVQSGPLLRPISMLSFALNYYFAGNFADTAPLKLTNLGIHVLNGLLLFWLLRLILGRLDQMGQAGPQKSGRHGVLNKNDLLAGAIALLWIVHPINLTSVLYIVQRMTSLSALFTLLALICYLIGRNLMVDRRRTGAWIIGIGVPVFGALGLFSKENTVLMPLYALVLEGTLFANETPWSRWPRLSSNIKRALIAIGIVVAGLLLVWVIYYYALPGYQGRPFSLPERLMTEGRVLFFYLWLILLPRIYAFGLHHDDIVVSTSLFQPWTTLPSLLGLVALLALALYVRKKHSLLTIGILWFFMSHLLESTIIPLEIAHEHRNYLASAGVLIAVVHLLDWGSQRLGHQRLWVLYPVIVMLFVGTTWLRASQWADHNSLARYEALHHPRSARAQAMLSSLLYTQGQYREAMDAIRRAAALAPEEPAYKINMQVLAMRLGEPLSPSVQTDTLSLLAKRPASPLTQLSLDYIGNCIARDCSQLQAPMKAWLNTAIDNMPRSQTRSFYYYLLGRTLIAQGRVLDGLNELERAYYDDRNYLHPLFQIASVFLQLGQIENAEFTLDRLRKANRDNLHPRDKEIAELAVAIEKRKQEIGEPQQGES
jgi:tetratricopeptide (TPR) repeat protein